MSNMTDVKVESQIALIVYPTKTYSPTCIAYYAKN